MPWLPEGEGRMLLPPKTSAGWNNPQTRPHQPLSDLRAPRPGSRARTWVRRAEGGDCSPRRTTRPTILRAAAAAAQRQRGRRGGVPSGVCDLATSRPEVPEGPLWGWRSQAVSPCALTVYYFIPVTINGECFLYLEIFFFPLKQRLVN